MVYINTTGHKVKREVMRASLKLIPHITPLITNTLSSHAIIIIKSLNLIVKTI
jgi:hypothetical protein